MVALGMLLDFAVTAADGKGHGSFAPSGAPDHTGFPPGVRPMGDRAAGLGAATCQSPALLTGHLHLKTRGQNAALQDLMDVLFTCMLLYLRKTELSFKCGRNVELNHSFIGCSSLPFIFGSDGDFMFMRALVYLRACDDMLVALSSIAWSWAQTRCWIRLPGNYV